MEPVRVRLYFLIIITFLSGVFLSQLKSDDASLIRIDNKTYYGSKERSSVDFPHEKHMQMDKGCTACHHDYRGKINILKLESLSEGNPATRCITCHGKYGKARERHHLMQAYHRLCIGCHSASRGPVLCGQCHDSQGVDK